MSEIDELLKSAINVTRDNRKKFVLNVGTVMAIEGDTCTVDDYEDVRLNAIIDDLESQFTVYPKIGSKVIIGMIENQSDYFVIKVSEIDKITIKIGNQIFEITDEKFSVKIENQLFEMQDGKFSIKTGSINLKSILNDAFNQLKSAVIITPAGNGSLSPADIAVFESLNQKVNQLLR